jgi:hypothetical protein
MPAIQINSFNLEDLKWRPRQGDAYLDVIGFYAWGMKIFDEILQIYNRYGSIFDRSNPDVPVCFGL